MQLSSDGPGAAVSITQPSKIDDLIQGRQDIEVDSSIGQPTTCRHWPLGAPQIRCHRGIHSTLSGNSSGEDYPTTCASID